MKRLHVTHIENNIGYSFKTLQQANISMMQNFKNFKHLKEK